MPRDSNGNYSLPVGNPVVTLTTITSTWANTTLDDIATALTNSLARDGSGGMTAPFKLVNGTIGAPGLSWITEPTSGLYRAGAGDFRYSIASNDRFSLTAATATFGVTTTTLHPDGVLATPGIAFLSDPDSGLYRSGANAIGLVVNALQTLGITTAGVYNLDGTVALPSYSFGADTNTGIYRNTADSIRVSAGGVDAGQISATGAYWMDGTVALPGISFLLDIDTGIRRVGSGHMRLVSDGVDTLQVSSTGTYGIDGTAALPSVSFINDVNTGIYRIGADDIGITTNGTLRVEVNSSGQLLYGGVEVGYRGMNSAANAGATFTLLAAHNGRVVSLSNGGAGVTLTLPVLAANTAIGLLNNQTTGNVTITRSGTNLFSFGFGNADRVLGPLGMATLWTIDGTNWIVNGAGIS